MKGTISASLRLGLALGLLCPGLMLADTKGKIAGHVRTAEDGAPMPGVNVYIVEQQLGSISDQDGFFAILNVPPGRHTVSASFVGYKTVTQTGVPAVSDQTTTIKFALETTILEGEEVIVTAERQLIQPDRTSSKHTITEEDLKILPAESFAALLTTKAGVTVDAGGSIHVRGGRASEVLYMMDGIQVTNPFSNTLGLSIPTSMISEVTLVSGTFNAEYGKAMSGIVNVVTRDGGRHLRGEMTVQAGDMSSQNTDVFEDADEFTPTTFTRADFNLSGPVPILPGGSFIISSMYKVSEGWLYGWKEHNTIDFGSFGVGEEAFVLLTGDSSRVPMNPRNDQSLMAKLNIKPWNAAKLTYQFKADRSFYQKYVHDWKFNPDGRYKYENGRYLHALHFSQSLSERTYFTLKGAFRRSEAEQYVHKLNVPFIWDENDTLGYTASGEPIRDDVNGDGLYTELLVDWDTLRVRGGYIPNPDWYTVDFPVGDTTFSSDIPYYVGSDTGNTPVDHFVYGGQRMGYFLSDFETRTLKFDLTSQVTPSHQIRTGIESNFYRMHSMDVGIKMHAGTYWQPKIEPASTTGPGHSEYVRKPVEFAAYLQDKIELSTIILQVGIRYDYFNSNDSTFTNKTDPKNDTVASAKTQISPRLGVSFPITDQGYIHFSYGHFSQMPPFKYLYRNPDLKRYPGTVLKFGNPDLEPQKTVMYELGLQQQLNYTTAVDVTLFYRDISNWLSSEYNFINNDFKYTRYITQDFGNIRGITLALIQRTGTGLAVNLDYTYQIAEGNASSADEAYYDNLKDPAIESEKKVVPLDWDVRHTANATVSYQTAGGLGISLITKYSTGLRYTPTIQGQRNSEENSGLKPVHLTSDLRANKSFLLGHHRLTATLKIYNLFDRLNERYVFTDTGRATYSLRPTYAGDPQVHYPGVAGIHSLAEYLSNPSNYRSPRQILLSLGWSF